MSQNPKKQPEVLSMPVLDPWELMKATAIEIKQLEFHQATPVFVVTSKTLAAFKTGLQGLRIWRTPSCFILEMKGKRQGIEHAAVATWIPV